jgi:hypothetical protein
MSYREFLSQYDNEWQGAKVKENEFSPIPDGKYQVRVDVARIDENEQNGSIFLYWEMEVVNGQYEGRKVFKRNGLDNPEKFDWLKTDLHRAGIKLEYISDIEDVLPDLLDRILEVNLKTGKPNSEGKTYQNCYINKLLNERAPFPGLKDVPFMDEDMPF